MSAVYKRGKPVVIGPFCEHGVSASFPCYKCLETKQETPLLEVLAVIAIIAVFVLVSC